MMFLAFVFWCLFAFVLLGKFWDRFLYAQHTEQYCPIARASKVAARGLSLRGAPRLTVRGARRLSIGHI